ncbi:hypothetical protein [Streptacidiphilus melanogenes]|uniref:hypothetical protein n=1 Tax=Streptacidiphilus melanogenes TaxID=411235 RepID=UPI00126A143B|nr:hypothetical protein [Streptacidiphilus melanogenes]
MAGGDRRRRPEPGAAASWALSAVEAWRGQPWIALVLAVLPMLVHAVVVGVAVASRSVARRKAALEVLRLLRGDRGP